MTRTRSLFPAFAKPSAKPLATVLLVAAALVAMQFSAPADAHGRGGRGGGWFIGGLVLGAAAFAPRYAYPSPSYYWPPTYYAPPPVVYSPPPVVYSAPPAVYSAPPQVVQQSAPIIAPAPLSMTVEDRLRRLRSMCDQGLFTPQECDGRRAQILQEM